MNFWTRIIVAIIVITSCSAEPVTQRTHGSMGVASFHRVERMGTWIETPVVVVCKDSGVTLGRVKSAMQFWQNLGYEFEGEPVIVSGSSMLCYNREPLPFHIIISPPTAGFNYTKFIGITRTWEIGEPTIIFKARIELIQSAAARPRVLEHELGHALGWKDNNIPKHIMNGTWKLSGTTTKGLKK